MLLHDRQLTISAAGSRKATRWPAQILYWSELVERLRMPARGSETLAEYLALPKSRQDDLKDVGGFVAGTLAGERRKAAYVTGRDVLTLDLDNIQPGGTQDTLCRLEALGCAYAVYSTRKNEPGRPRLRVLVPLNRTASADEYEALARKLAGIIGIDLCDPTTFEASRLMYWPSCSADSQYVFAYSDKPFADADGLLATYVNWRNTEEWPKVPGADQAQVKRVAQQGDPTTKTGVVGAFCKMYDVYRAMDLFLPGVYEPCDTPGRYTFTGGSTVGGAVIYDNGNFLYSHHATDPVSGRLVNAFDLVRLHKFGAADDEAKPDTPANKLPSYTAMCEFAVADTGVAALLNQERYERATQDFATAPDDNANWISLLAVSPTTGQPAKTSRNVLIVLENDPLLKRKIVFDEFSNRGLVIGSLPWDPRNLRRDWSNTDDQGLRDYIEYTYGITGPSKIEDALGLCAHKNTINDVQDYLKTLVWDGVKRLDTLLIDYLGAADNAYVRNVTRKAFTAAVARAMAPGVKFDWVLILAGPQGVGKSTLLRLMGKRWYSDSLVSFDGKEASEMIQGVWINELGELSSLNKSETNIAKQFISRTEDIYREPFGRRTNRYPRKCVFFGTTNENEFLKDPTGGRRFWPVTLMEKDPVKDVFNGLKAEINLIWAEAYTRWQLGESLHLAPEIETMARIHQEAYKEGNAKEGLILAFLEKPVPIDWDMRTLNERRIYWGGEFERGTVDTVPREKICAAEIWCECLGSDIKFMKQTDSREINTILGRLPGWEKSSNGRQFGKPYGLQRGYIKSPLH